MKKLFFLTTVTAVICTTLLPSCKKNFLDVQPQGIISSDAAYSTFSAVTALRANLYGSLPIEDLNFTVIDEAGYPCELTDEAIRSYVWGNINNGPIPVGAFGLWNYSQIRALNDFIARVPSSPALSESQKAQYVAEARFMRAFTYFEMVKRYGGVPLVTSVQQFTGSNLDQLKVPRNKEQEVYDFIGKELDTAAQILPEANTTIDGTLSATRYAALALKSRAMLYAASDAKYGTVQLNGLVGIPSELANGYWQQAYDAANAIIKSGKFSLYNAFPDDKVNNFVQLFQTADQPSNPEAIFVESYVYPNRTTSFDFYNQPNGYWTNYSSAINPTLELVQSYENVDGSPHDLPIADANGNPILYSNPADLFAKKDPRMKATVLYPNIPWADNGKAGVIDLRRGIIDKGVVHTDNAINASVVYGTPPNTIQIVGAQGPLTTNGDATKTGFYVQKFLTNSAAFIPNQGYSVVPFMVFRYGETLLNFAEAAVELGKNDDALMATNLVRARAGITPLQTVTRDTVRHERRVEMAFENQRLWDLRRWKIADKILNNTVFHALWPFLMWQDNTAVADMKYTFQIAPSPRNPRTFSSNLYYERIDPAQIQLNTNLVQNPGY